MYHRCRLSSSGFSPHYLQASFLVAPPILSTNCSHRLLDASDFALNITASLRSRLFLEKLIVIMFFSSYSNELRSYEWCHSSAYKLLMKISTETRPFSCLSRGISLLGASDHIINTTLILVPSKLHKHGIFNLVANSRIDIYSTTDFSSSDDPVFVQNGPTWLLWCCWHWANRYASCNPITTWCANISVFRGPCTQGFVF